MNNRELQRRLDRISAARISRIKPIEFHVALGSINSITLRNKLNRMGLKGSHIDAAVNMIDEIGFQKVLSNQPLASRFATMKKSKTKPKIWNPDSD